MTPLQVVLTLWRYGHMPDGEVRDWAWRQIAREPSPSQELLDLATDGPQSCLKRSEADFSARPIELSFAQEFSLRAVRTSLQSQESLLELARWAAKRAMGEDLSDPLVQLAYQWDHQLGDCGAPEEALALARTKLPEALPRCHALAAAFVASEA